MNQEEEEEEEEEGATNNPPLSPGSDNSDSSSNSYLTAAKLSPILEESSDTPPREEQRLLTPLRKSNSPRSAKPIKRRQKYLSSRGEKEPEAQLDHNNSALSGSGSGDSTDSSIPDLALYLAGHPICYERYN